MGIIHVTVKVKALAAPNGTYQADFLVDTRATDCLAPGSELRKIGVEPVGETTYELADGRIENISMVSSKSNSWVK